MEGEDSRNAGSSISIRMLAMQEAFADPFQQGNLMDSSHLKELDPSGVSATAEWRKARRVLFSQHSKAAFPRRGAGKENGSIPAANAKEGGEGGYDPDKVFRTNPGFDPVFMKI